MIIPIKGFYIKEQIWEVMGSGFVINPDLFITAAHNIYSLTNKKMYSDFIIEFGETKYHLKNPTFKEYKDKSEYNMDDTLCCDLAIYKINVLLVSLRPSTCFPNKS